MSLLIILMVMEQNGIPAWAMGTAWALLVLSVLNMFLQIILRWD